jgi:F-box-like
MSFPGPDSIDPPLDETSHRQCTNDVARKIPDEVFAVIASFLSDATTLCRCSAVCTAFHDVIQHNETLWKNLADTVWKIAPVPREPPISADATVADTAHSFYQAEYRRRHELDRSIDQIVCSMAESLVDPDDLRAALLIRFRWGAGIPAAERLAQIFPFSTDIANVAARHNDPIQALDGLRRFVLAGFGIGRRSATIYCVALCVLDNLYFCHVYRRWMHVLLQLKALPPKPADDEYTDSAAEMSLLLDGLTVLSQLLVDDQELLQSSQFELLMRPDAITKPLHEYGAHLLQELHERHGGAFSFVEAMQTLSELFFNDWGFVAKPNRSTNPSIPF